MATCGKVQVGKPAPDFKCTAVVDGRFKDVSLSSYTESKHWLILIFFPKAWSFICPTEIKAFSARLEEFLYSRTCAVLFVSTDSDHCLRAWNNTSDMEGGLGGVHVPLMSDINHKVSKDYGVLIEEEGVAQRALFIIDPKGIVRSITVNDADVGRSVDEARRLLDALVFKDEFGEGCPVDWKKGDKGIDVATKNKVEGEIDLGKKTWTEWARPKLNRAWSGTSARSVSSVMSNSGNMRLTSAPDLMVNGGSPYHSAGHSSGQQSPLLSPLLSPSSVARPGDSRFERQMDDAMLLQRMENMQAAMQNQGVASGSVGSAM